LSKPGRRYRLERWALVLHEFWDYGPDGSICYGRREQCAGSSNRLFVPGTPAVAANAAGYIVEPETIMLPFAGRRILLVEDNARLRDTTESILKSLGHNVVAASNAAEALDIWSSDNCFDIVFSDVVMPGHMNGVELALTLLADSPKLKVLLTSGFVDPANASDLLRDAKLPMIHKPYRKAELAAQLEQLIS
jgi:CheY-like chemotaxis protein